MSDPTRHQAAAYRSAAPGTLNDLHSALAGRITDVAAAFWTLSTKAATERAPAVIDGWLPPMATPEVERFPFLIVRPRSGVDSEQEAHQVSSAVFEIIVGTWSDTDDGWRDVLQLIQSIRDDIAAAPSIAGTGFEHTGPLAWEIPEEQPRPQWFGRITTNWTLPRMRRVEARNPAEE